jgi:hypothetical protein
VQDGKNYFTYTKNFYEISKNNTYQFANFIPQSYGLFRETLNVYNHIHTNNAQVGCSAGRTQLALTQKNDISICHRMFYVNDENYHELFGSFFKDNDYYYGFENGRGEIMKKHLLARNDVELSKMTYMYSGYHDYHKLKLSFAFSIIREMALSGLISEQYKKDDFLTELLATMIVRRECSVDNVLTTGSIHIIPGTSVKMFGNGVFEMYYNKMFCEEK